RLQAEPRPLADGIHRDAVVLADYRPTLVDDRAGLDLRAKALLQQGPVASVRHKADLLAVGLGGGDEAERGRFLAHLVLRPLADGKAQNAPLTLAQLIEDIRLVLALVDRLAKGIGVGTSLDASVVAGRQRVGAQPQRLAQQQAELDRLVAADARVRGAS